MLRIHGSSILHEGGTTILIIYIFNITGARVIMLMLHHTNSIIPCIFCNFTQERINNPTNRINTYYVEMFVLL